MGISNARPKLVRGVASTLWLVALAAGPCDDITSPLPIDFTLSAPSAAFNAVELGTNPASSTVSLSIVGDGTLNWTVTDNAPWLSVTPSSDSGAATVTLSVDIAGLAVGSHTAVVTINAQGSVSGRKAVNVTLTLEPAPRIAFSAETLYYAVTLGDTAKQSKAVQISNAGGSTLNWAASTSAASGTGPASITVTVNPALHQFVGTFVGPITVTAGRRRRRSIPGLPRASFRRKSVRKASMPGRTSRASRYPRPMPRTACAPSR